jgi:hypothetical protein
LLAVEEKSSRVISESVTAPGSIYPQILSSGIETGEKIDRKKDESPEEEKNIGCTSHHNGYSTSTLN